MSYIYDTLVYTKLIYFDTNFSIVPLPATRQPCRVVAVATATALPSLYTNWCTKQDINITYLFLSITKEPPHTQQKQQQNYIWPDLYLPVISYSLSGNSIIMHQGVNFFSLAFLHLVICIWFKFTLNVTVLLLFYTVLCYSTPSHPWADVYGSVEQQAEQKGSLYSLAWCCFFSTFCQPTQKHTHKVCENTTHKKKRR